MNSTLFVLSEQSVGGRALPQPFNDSGNRALRSAQTGHRALGQFLRFQAKRVKFRPMRCPFCDADKESLKVIDSRACEGGRAIRRRRECLRCSKRFTTYERIED